VSDDDRARQTIHVAPLPPGAVLALAPSALIGEKTVAADQIQRWLVSAITLGHMVTVNPVLDILPGAPVAPTPKYRVAWYHDATQAAIAQVANASKPSPTPRKPNR
jgi:uncharacterized protein YqiB (DUF1249 family)